MLCENFDGKGDLPRLFGIIPFQRPGKRNGLLRFQVCGRQPFPVRQEEGQRRRNDGNIPAFPLPKIPCRALSGQHPAGQGQIFAAGGFIQAIVGLRRDPPAVSDLQSAEISRSFISFPLERHRKQIGYRRKYADKQHDTQCGDQTNDTDKDIKSDRKRLFPPRFFRLFFLFHRFPFGIFFFYSNTFSLPCQSLSEKGGLFFFPPPGKRRRLCPARLIFYFLIP